MQDQPGSTRVPPNPRHTRQVFWQITFPLILAAVIVLAAAVLVVLGSQRGLVSAGQMASISIIWMIAPLIIIVVIFLLFTAGMIFLLSRAIRVLPVYTRLIQLWVQIFGLRVENFMDLLARPAIGTGARAAGWKAFWKQLWRR